MTAGSPGPLINTILARFIIEPGDSFGLTAGHLGDGGDRRKGGSATAIEPVLERFVSNWSLIEFQSCKMTFVKRSALV